MLRKALSGVARMCRKEPDGAWVPRFGKGRIIADPPLIVPIEDVAASSAEPVAIEDELRGLIRSFSSSPISRRIAAPAARTSACEGEWISSMP